MENQMIVAMTSVFSTKLNVGMQSLERIDFGPLLLYIAAGVLFFLGMVFALLYKKTK